MKNLDRSAEKITKSASMVDGTAFQTSILALGAAIAAGGSGEVGDRARHRARSTTRSAAPTGESAGTFSQADARRLTADLAVLAHVLRQSCSISEGLAPSPARIGKFPRWEQEDTF